MLPIDSAVVKQPEGDKEGHVPDMRWPLKETLEGHKPEGEGLLHHGDPVTAVVLPPENAVLFTPAPTP